MARAWLGGSAFMLAAHHWLVPNIGPFALLPAAVFGAPVALWGRAAWHLLRAATSPWRAARAALVLAGSWVLVEARRSWDRLGGPWDLLGASQRRTGWLLSLAALGGVWLVSFALVAVNVALVTAAGPGVTSRARAAGAALAVAVLAAAGLWSAARPDSETGETARVVGVQPGVIHAVEPRFAASEAASLPRERTSS